MLAGIRESVFHLSISHIPSVVSFFAVPSVSHWFIVEHGRLLITFPPDPGTCRVSLAYSRRAPVDSGPLPPLSTSIYT